MKHIPTTVYGLALAAVVVAMATAHTPGIAMTADVQPPASVAPAYPHNINPDPNGPYYVNPYDPYQNGLPEHSPAVIDGSHNIHRPGYTNGAPDPQPRRVMAD